MAFEEFARLVSAMRTAQRRWFRDHTQADLTEAKKLERAVDRALAEIEAPAKQPALFE